MSGTPDIPGDGALAAEHALGVLGAAEHAAAERRMAGDPAFAAEVEAWRARLAPLFDEIAPVDPPAEHWRRVERALPASRPANDNGALVRSLRFWRAAAGASLGLAAASLAAAVMLANRPPTVVLEPAAPGPLLNASLDAQAGGRPMFIAAYDPDRHALLVTSLVPPGGDPAHVHQLWLIPSDGRPRSLGFVEPGASKCMPMAQDMAPMFAEGAALAVSVEAPGGSTQAGPTGPVAAIGKLARI